MPFIARAGRPGILGVAARTAVVAGTATAVSGSVARRQHERAAKAAAQAGAASAPPPPPPAPSPAPAAGDDLMTRLEQLVAMQQQGLLTAEEFTLAKQRLLAG